MSKDSLGHMHDTMYDAQPIRKSNDYARSSASTLYHDPKYIQRQSYDDYIEDVRESERKRLAAIEGDKK